MRNLWVGLAGGFIALVGFAGTASALVTISMLWDATGTTDIIDPTGSIVLNVYVNTGTGPGSTRGGTMSIDWSGAPELTYNTFSTPGDFDLPLPGTTNTATQLKAMGGFSFFPEAVGTAVLFGTITFDVTPGGAGVLNIIALYTASDGIEDLTELSNFMDPSGFLGGGVTITRTPEPGTLSLLVMGLSGLYVVGRRRGR